MSLRPRTSDYGRCRRHHRLRAVATFNFAAVLCTYSWVALPFAGLGDTILTCKQQPSYARISIAVCAESKPEDAEQLSLDPQVPQREFRNEDLREPGSFANIGTFQIRRPLAAIPILLLGIVADLGGSMRFLLSLNPKLAREIRADGVYGVAPPGGNPLFCGLQPSACQKRYYGGSPYFCTFVYPGDWSEDPSVAMARQAQQDESKIYSTQRRQGPSSKPLPLTAVGPPQGAGRDGFSVSLYTRKTGAKSLLQALGTPDAALADLMGRFTAQAPKLRGDAPVSETVLAEQLIAEDVTYRFESKVRYPGDDDDQALSVWTTALFSPAGSSGGYILLLTGVAPIKASGMMREAVRDASRSLARLEESQIPGSMSSPQ